MKWLTCSVNLFLLGLQALWWAWRHSKLSCPHGHLDDLYSLALLPGEIVDNKDRAYLNTGLSLQIRPPFSEKANADEAPFLARIRMSLMLVWPHCQWSDALDMISIAPRQPEYLISTCLVNISASLERESRSLSQGLISKASGTNLLPTLFIPA